MAVLRGMIAANTSILGKKMVIHPLIGESSCCQDEYALMLHKIKNMNPFHIYKGKSSLLTENRRNVYFNP